MGLISRRDVRNISEREEPEEEEGLDPDRPHLPEASTTVGKGRIVLEFGYTFTGKDSTFSSHAYPEALLRIGMFADWLEFRVGQNFLSQAHTLVCFFTENFEMDIRVGIGLNGQANDFLTGTGFAIRY